MNFNVAEINKFWTWFKSISVDLLANPTDNSLVTQLDNRVSILGHFDWEIGPWGENLYYFTISPNLNITRLELTQQMIDSAPQCEGWHFLPSKPPKVDWKGIWKMKNEVGKEILIDTNNWKYILYKFDDGTFDADIKINNIDGDEDTQNLAVDIAITGYIGEENFIRLINHINIVDQFEEDTKSNSSLLKHIKKHIERVM
jgi:hypothetical protein